MIMFNPLLVIGWVVSLVIYQVSLVASRACRNLADAAGDFATTCRWYMEMGTWLPNIKSPKTPR